MNNFYKLLRDQRIVDNPGYIGGRDTDIGAIGASLKDSLRDYFEINQVPSELLDEVNELCKILDLAESKIEQFIENVSKAKLKELDLKESQ